MSHKLLHVFKNANRQRLFDSRKVVELSAMFQIVEQRSSRYTCADEDGCPAENVGIRMHAGNLALHASTSPDFGSSEYTSFVFRSSFLVWLTCRFSRGGSGLHQPPSAASGS